MSFHVAEPPPGERAVHPVDEVLPPAKLGIYGAQHARVLRGGGHRPDRVRGGGRAARRRPRLPHLGRPVHVIAPYYSRLLRLFPPVVTGTVILVIAAVLLGLVFGMLVATVFGITTCFAETVGLVRLARVKSRFVVATAGVNLSVKAHAKRVEADGSGVAPAGA